MKELIVVLSLLHGISDEHANTNSIVAADAALDVNDSAVPFWLEKMPDRFAIRIGEYVRHIVYFTMSETDYWRLDALVSPTGLGVAQTLFLGSAFSTELELAFSPFGLTAPVTFSWYPIKGVQLSSGIDLFRWRTTFSANLTP
jgi:hypothetical protein